MRKEKEPYLKVEFENEVQKIEFDPFYPKEFVILFKSYFVKVNFQKMKYYNYYFEGKKIYDISFN